MTDTSIRGIVVVRIDDDTCFVKGITAVPMPKDKQSMGGAITLKCTEQGSVSAQFFASEEVSLYWRLNKKSRTQDAAISQPANIVSAVLTGRKYRFLVPEGYNESRGYLPLADGAYVWIEFLGTNVRLHYVSPDGVEAAPDKYGIDESEFAGELNPERAVVLLERLLEASQNV